ncbi:MAG: class I SAM-dependent methyltransferase [Helicobacteraceae bacterium]|jgi:adenine-specific DNA-methyltransferase|nr:class I SAM-dependent methyltransferase [Helicobacteraceae bacterium]
MSYNVKYLGQVFTPSFIASDMLGLRKNFGSALEPSQGDGAFSRNIANCVSIEIDKRYCDEKTLNIDFFDYAEENTFDTIIGNPPYVRYQDILPETKAKLKSNLFDERTNLYLFFIEKSIRHLNHRGELIFITPREFLKATSSVKLNHFIYTQGTITDLIDLGDKKIFEGFTPNCVIFRFEKGNFSRRTNLYQIFTFNNGQLLFTNNRYSITLREAFNVKVGAVSGNDKIFTYEEFANAEFVNSATAKTGKTRKMIFNENHSYLEQYKDILIKRKIKKFGENDWWQWGRLHHISDRKRIYVNCKTRNKNPFFIHPCKNYDGSILALFPKDQKVDIEELCERLNGVNWLELGFVCDGRYIFSQKSLENALLPDEFTRYIVKSELF